MWLSGKKTETGRPSENRHWDAGFLKIEVVVGRDVTGD
jgi:hypothetical protein